jgi:hypothetical protein
VAIPGRGAGEQPVAAQLPGMPRHAEGEGLAGPRPPHHQRDALAALADVADHAGLGGSRGGGVGAQRRANRVVGRDGGLLAGAVPGGDDEPLLDGQQLRGGPAALLQRPVGHHRDRPLGEEPVGQLLQLDSGGAGQLAAEGGDHLLAGEGGRLRGQPGRPGQPVERLGHRPLGQTLLAVARPSGHLADEGLRVHAAFGRLGPPAVVQCLWPLMLLGLAGGVDGPLHQPGRPRPSGRLQPFDLQVDLVAALGERPDEVLGHPLELAVAVPVGRRPLDSERPDKLALVGGAVDGVGGQPMAVQVAAVQRRPPSVRALDAVGDHQVGVQQRIAFSGRPVVEPDRQQPLAGHVLMAGVAAAGPDVGVQVADSLADAGVVGIQDRPAGGRIPEAVEDGHALGGAQHHVERGHGDLAVRSAEGSPVWGWRPSNIRRNPPTDASPSNPNEAAPAPSQRPGDSPWPDRYAWWSVASSRV